MMNKDYKPEIIHLKDVPEKVHRSRSIWKKRFLELPMGKAVMLKYNNRQRAHHVVSSIRTQSSRHKIAIGVRIIHDEQAIPGINDWVVYWWRIKS